MTRPGGFRGVFFPGIEAHHEDKKLLPKTIIFSNIPLDKERWVGYVYTI